MWNLEDVNSGTDCRIVWLLGETGTWLRQIFHFDEEDMIRVIRNDGEGVIIDHNHHRYAMGNEAAHAVKVIPAQ